MIVVNLGTTSQATVLIPLAAAFLGAAIAGAVNLWVQRVQGMRSRADGALERAEEVLTELHESMRDLMSRLLAAANGRDGVAVTALLKEIPSRTEQMYFAAAVCTRACVVNKRARRERRVDGTLHLSSALAEYTELAGDDALRAIRTHSPSTTVTQDETLAALHDLQAVVHATRGHIGAWLVNSSTQWQEPAERVAEGKRAASARRRA